MDLLSDEEKKTKKKKKKKKNKQSFKSENEKFESNNEEITNKKSEKKNPKFISENGLESGKIYTELKHFKKISKNEDIKKVMIMGLEGTGKSSFLNALANAQIEKNNDSDDSDIEESVINQKTMFDTGTSKFAVTKESSFILAHALGKKKKIKLMLIDTPGVLGVSDISEKNDESFDSDSSDQDQEEVDKYSLFISKLKALTEIHMILIMLPLEKGGRLHPDLINLLKGINYMFENNDKNIFDHLIFCFSKCDEDSPSNWELIKEKKDEEYNTLSAELSKYEIEIESNVKHPLLFVTSKKKNSKNLGQKKEIKNLLKMIKKSKAISTKTLSNPRKFFVCIIYFFLINK